MVTSKIMLINVNNAFLIHANNVLEVHNVLSIKLKLKIHLKV